MSQTARFSPRIDGSRVVSKLRMKPARSILATLFCTVLVARPRLLATEGYDAREFWSSTSMIRKSVESIHPWPARNVLYKTLRVANLSHFGPSAVFNAYWVDNESDVWA